MQQIFLLFVTLIIAVFDSVCHSRGVNRLRSIAALKGSAVDQNMRASRCIGLVATIGAVTVIVIFEALASVGASNSDREFLFYELLVFSPNLAYLLVVRFCSMIGHVNYSPKN